MSKKNTTSPQVQERLTTIIKYLEGKEAIKPCVMCGAQEWFGDIFKDVLMPYPDAELSFPPHYVKWVSFICNNCGHTVFYSLKVLEEAMKKSALG